MFWTTRKTSDDFLDVSRLPSQGGGERREEGWVEVGREADYFAMTGFDCRDKTNNSINGAGSGEEAFAAAVSSTAALTLPPAATTNPTDDVCA